MLSELRARLAALVFRRRVDAELDEEMRYHLERDVERNVANGMSQREAETSARRAFGNVTIATEHARDAWRWRFLEELRQDVTFARRAFTRAPGFVFTVVATIGLGLGLLTTAFTVFNTYVLRPLAVREPASLFELVWYAENGGGHLFAWPQYVQLDARSTLFRESFAYTLHSTRLRGSAALGQLVTGNYFEMLGVPPALGRTLVKADVAPPTDGSVIVLSHRTWQSVFGGDSAIVGTTIDLRGVPMTVVGVAREGFGGLGSVPCDFWAPLTAARLLGESADPFAAKPPEALHVVGRLRSGATVDETSRAIVAWLRETITDRPAAQRARTALLMARGTALPANGEVLQLFAPIGVAFLLVMLIACANVANMMLARGLSRQREIGVRLALGAGRARLLRQLLTEAVLLALPAAIIGFVISRVAIDASIRIMFATVPTAYADYLRVIPLDADARTAAFMLGFAALSAIAFGLAPALQATRPNIVQASRGDFDTEFRPSRLRNGLVVAQITFSVVLLVSAGVLLGNARHARELDPGVRTHDVLQIDVADASRGQLLDGLRSDARVREVASAMWAPLDGGWWVINLTNGRTSTGTNANLVSPEYFSTVGMRLIAGRTFSADEGATHAPVAVVSEAAAREFWPDRSPLGETISVPAGSDSTPFTRFRHATVIGVVGNAMAGSILRPMTWPTVYYPQSTDARGAHVLVRTNGEADRVLPLLQRTLLAADSVGRTRIDIGEMHSLATSFAIQAYPFQAAYWLASAIGVVALLLTLTGVYGVLSYVVSGRRKEMGIRLALGAAASTVIALIYRESLRLALIGLAVGLALALALSKLLAGILVVANVFDLTGYVGGTLLVLVACALASYIPSRRAASANPVDALRADS